MAPSLKDLQLTSFSGSRKHTLPTVSDEDSDDLEDVRLLDSYDHEQAAININEDENKDKEFRTIQVGITGMTCAACSNSVESALLGVVGVVRASVALLQNKADVVFDPQLVQNKDIKIAIEDAGFDAEILSDSSSIRSKSRETLTGQFRITGMTCAACVNSVEGILRELPGIKRAVVALATSLGEVDYDPLSISKDDIVNAIEDAGIEATFLQSNEQDKILLMVFGVSNQMDVHLVESILGNMKGVRQFRFDWALGELEVHFDPEMLGSRSIVDGIVGASNGKFIVNVRNPYTAMNSNSAEESSQMFRLFISSLVLS